MIQMYKPVKKWKEDLRIEDDIEPEVGLNQVQMIKDWLQAIDEKCQKVNTKKVIKVQIDFERIIRFIAVSRICDWWNSHDSAATKSVSKRSRVRYKQHKSN